MARLRRVSESLWQTTRVLPGRLRLREDDSERAVGTAPPAQGWTVQSGAGSGQYALRSTWADAAAGSARPAVTATTSASRRSFQPTVLMCGRSPECVPAALSADDAREGRRTVAFRAQLPGGRHAGRAVCLGSSYARSGGGHRGARRRAHVGDRLWRGCLVVGVRAPDGPGRDVADEGRAGAAPRGVLFVRRVERVAAPGRARRAGR